MSGAYDFKGSEKEEKEFEKQEEKEEKETHEKSWDEKYRRDPLSGMVWASLLIWAGVASLAGNLGYLASLEPLDVWDLIFVGAGGILLLEVLVRLTVPMYRRPVMGTVILAVLLFSVGLQDLPSWNLLWPVGIIIAGVIILLRGILRR